VTDCRQEKIGGRSRSGRSLRQHSKMLVSVPNCTLVWLLLMTTCGYSANLDWTAAENVPFTIRSGVEVARHATGKTPAALSLVCSAPGTLHLLLRTRLPIPRAFARTS
jgi:hypothetical protein